MLNITDEVKATYKSDNVHKELEIRIPDANLTIGNEDILVESLSLTESIESTSNLSFTGCIASILKIQTVDIVESIEGLWIEVDITADDVDPLPLFRGYIDTVTNTTHEEYTTEILAYDALYKVNNKDVTNWYNSLSFPITVMNMRNSFFNYVGITQEADYLPNDAMTVYQSIEDKVINGATIIKSICQVNGRFGRIGRNGQFQYVHLVEGTEALYPREDLYPADDLYPAAENAIDNVLKATYSSLSFENYRVAPIDKVQVVDKDGQIAVTAGNGTNVFTLKDNPLVWGKTAADLSQVATNLYNTIQGLWYTPADVSCMGLPYVECGDFVLMRARRSIIRAYVLNRELSGIQTLKDHYTAKGERYQPAYVPSIKQAVAANSHAIKSETSRAKSSESGLQSGINSNSSKISRVDADLGNFKSVTTDNISAINGNISNLRADVANVNSLVATKASISQLDAVSARIGSLEARAITTGSLRSAIANLGSIAVSTVNASYLVANGTSTSSLTVGGTGVQWIGKWIDGKWCKYLGSS